MATGDAEQTSEGGRVRVLWVDYGELTAMEEADYANLRKLATLIEEGGLLAIDQFSFDIRIVAHEGPLPDERPE